MGNAVADLQPVLGLTYLGLGCSLTEMCYAVADLQPVLDLTWLGLQSYWKYDQDWLRNEYDIIIWTGPIIVDFKD